jgi:phosphoribosylformimino-5-aminoimidazole carboxamide ribotide isomerase
MLVIPSIDLRKGRCVRLLKGNFERETVYSDDPLTVARGYLAAGAARLHVVDLDAARGDGDNREVVGRLARESGLHVQVAGGVRGPSDAARWLEAGAWAVVMGTTAVRQPEVLAETAAAHPDRVWAALDVRGGQAAVIGWEKVEPASPGGLIERWMGAPVAGVIVTSIERDGTMTGPDLDLLRWTLERSSRPVVYSGGIASIGDLHALAAAGAAGAILGRSLYEGGIDLQVAIGAVA